MISKKQAIDIIKDFLDAELGKEDWFINVKLFIKALVKFQLDKLVQV